MKRLVPWSPDKLALALVLLGLMGGTACQGAKETRAETRTLSGVLCLDGTVACGDTCERLASSPGHCGMCGNACADNLICDRGACVPLTSGCSMGRSLCGGGCVDSSSDPSHCGSCEQSCAPEADCNSGSCVCPADLTACGAACADLQNDAAHCGGCGIGCVDTQTCEAGSCACPTGQELCAETCVDTQTDLGHCGSCGNVCGGGQVCNGGSCECPAGEVSCDDSCANTQTSTEHCGACGTACTGGQLCAAGSCECPIGTLLCGGQCIDTQSDEANCGGCGSVCGLGEGCNAGACVGGALGEDGCQGLAQNLSVTQVAAYQTVKTELARDAASVEPRTIDLVAGRPTLLRLFVAPGAAWAPRELSARLHLDTGNAVTVHYSNRLSINAASTEANRDSTFEFILPKAEVTSDARYAVEVVECGAGVGALLQPRFPATDAAELGALALGGLRIHIVPLRSNNRLPDTSQAMLDNIYGRSFLNTFPVSNIEFSVGQPVDIADPEDWNNTLDTVRALRGTDAPDPDVYYYGMLQPSANLGEFCGGGCTAGVGFVSNGRPNPGARAAVGLAYGNVSSAFTMLHEVAHNHGRNHAPCVQGGTIAGVDQNYPYDGGIIGVFGYDSDADELIAPDDATDLMGYCRQQWLSDYTYGGLLDTVIAVNQVQASMYFAPERLGAWRVMLVDATRGARWGRRIAGPEVASGTEETARVLDAGGNALESVSVYRTEVSDIGAFSIQVPEPEPGWHSIQVAGAPALAYPAL